MSSKTNTYRATCKFAANLYADVSCGSDNYVQLCVGLNTGIKAWFNACLGMMWFCINSNQSLVFVAGHIVLRPVNFSLSKVDGSSGLYLALQSYDPSNLCYRLVHANYK